MNAEATSPAVGLAHASDPSVGTVDAAIADEQRRIDEARNPLTLEPVQADDPAQDEVATEEGEDAQVSDDAEAEQQPAEGDDAEQPSTIEIDHGGKKYRVPAELKDSFMLKADYTRKTQELAEKNRYVDTIAQDTARMFQVGEQFAQAKAALMGVVAQEQDVWTKLTSNPNLEQEDFVTYTTLGTKLMQLQIQKQQIQGFLGNATQQHSEYQNKLRNQRIGEAVNYLSDKGFDEPRWRETSAFIRSLNLPPHVAAAIDGGEFPGAFELFDELRQARKNKADRKAVQTKVAAAPPVVKPGSAPQKTTNAEILGKKLRSSGTVSDAIALEMALASRPRQASRR